MTPLLRRSASVRPRGMREAGVINVNQCSLCITYVCDSYIMNISDHVKCMFHLSYNINHTYILSLVLGDAAFWNGLTQ